MAELIQASIDDLMVANARATDPATSHLAALGVNVREKQRLALQALRALKRSNPQPVEAWRVRRKAQAIQERNHPRSKPLGESTIRTRLNELTKRELVDCVDHLGLTESGGKCSRYAITRRGLDALKEEA
jgi:hypothetical protein